MSKNIRLFVFALILAVLAAPAFAQDADSYCKQLPLAIREALDNVPAASKFPCDAQHIVVIRDLHQWVVKAANGNYDKDTRYKDVEKSLSGLLGFTFAERFPIYVNVPSDRLAFFSYGTDPTAQYRLACVFVHENLHAAGHEARESVAYQAELDCLTRFQQLGYLSPSFDFRPIKATIAEFKTEERKAELKQVAMK